MAKGTVNKVIIIGRLGNDPELRTTGGGTSVANVSVATCDFGPKDPQTGQRQSVTEWHNVTLFGKMADNASAYLVKGSSIYIEGRIQTDKYEKDGQTVYRAKIIASNMQFIGGQSDKQTTPPQQPQKQPQRQGTYNKNTPAPFDSFDDDLPWC